ncbi:TnsA endonuclease N-terminal domain-containing protein [Flavobacterium cupreum]|nr:TnsA endonuclease N-terminal domain-containing protein [Flavobacterium cupreum]
MLRILKKRVREIGPKYSSLSGYFISKKQDSELIQFESSLERDYIYLLEFDTSVYLYLEQPLSITYFDSNNKRHKYTPDFLVRYSDKNICDKLVEIKYHDDLIRNSLKYSEKFNAAREYCKKNNLTFVILSEKEIRNSNIEYLTSVKFLSSYRDAFEIFEKNGHKVEKPVNLTT